MVCASYSALPAGRQVPSVKSVKSVVKFFSLFFEFFPISKNPPPPHACRQAWRRRLRAAAMGRRICNILARFLVIQV